LKSAMLAVAAITLSFMLSPVTLVQARDFDLVFESGRSYGVASAAVTRGEADNHYFGARPGQAVSIAVTALEDNAVVELAAFNDGNWVFTSGTSEARTRYGALPPSDNGQYRVSVSSTRGNATYDLFVGISAVDKN
jgi:hypothetical protein